MLSPYRAVLFDAFRTLVNVGDLAPMMRWQAASWKAATRAVMARLARIHELLGSDEFFAALETVTRECAQRRQQSLREIPLAERYAAALRQLGADPSWAAGILSEIVEAHRDAVVRHCAVLPAAREVVLLCRGLGLKVGIVSNFDDATSLRRILQRDQIEGYLDAIVVSEEVGWRKPHPNIFRHALLALGVEPPETLFVGDSFSEDVTGPSHAGMDTAWLRSGCEPHALEALEVQPTFCVNSLHEVVQLLGLT